MIFDQSSRIMAATALTAKPIFPAGRPDWGIEVRQRSVEPDLERDEDV